MNARREGKTPEKISIEIDPVFEDPRWEKLALGDATREEIGDLLAWATRSSAAKAAWEAFRPAAGEELERLTRDVMSGLDAPMPNDQRERLDRLFEAQKRLPPPKIPAAIGGSYSSNGRAVQHDQMIVQRSFHAQQRPQRVQQQHVGRDGPFRSASSITTSRVVAFSRESTEVPRVDEIASLITAEPVEAEVAMPARHQRQSKRKILTGLSVVAALVVYVLMGKALVEIASGMKDKATTPHQSPCTLPLPPSAAEASPGDLNFPAVHFEHRPTPEGVQPPSMTATSEPTKPAIATSASVVPSPVAPQVPSSGNRASTAKSPKAPFQAPTNPRDAVCTGFGVFKKCTTNTIKARTRLFD